MPKQVPRVTVIESGGKDLFVIVDGLKIAKRGHHGTKHAWNVDIARTRMECPVKSGSQQDRGGVSGRAGPLTVSCKVTAVGCAARTSFEVAAFWNIDHE
jgi:hypothetical protein